MPFPPEERQALLSVKGVNPGKPQGQTTYSTHIALIRYAPFALLAWCRGDLEGGFSYLPDQSPTKNSSSAAAICSG